MPEEREREWSDPSEDPGESGGLSQDDPAGGIGGQGGEGSGAAEATPPIGEEGEPGSTEDPAPDDDAGSSDEESQPDE